MPSHASSGATHDGADKDTTAGDIISSNQATAKAEAKNVEEPVLIALKLDEICALFKTSNDALAIKEAD